MEICELLGSSQASPWCRGGYTLLSRCEPREILDNMIHRRAQGCLSQDHSWQQYKAQIVELSYNIGAELAWLGQDARVTETGGERREG